MTSQDRLSPADWGMVGLPGDRDALCATPKPRAGQARCQMRSPVSRQLSPGGALSSHLSWGLQQQADARSQG